MKQIAEGAEARIYLEGNRIVKDRISKGYRIKEIDERLRKFRTRREAKIFGALQRIGFPLPRLLASSDKSMRIEMDFVNGKKLRDILNARNCSGLCRKIGADVGVLHRNNIIHGDLTTSNMILKDKRVYFIDFGLGFFSNKIEDKAVDLHLLRQALESRHHKIWQKCFDAVIAGYRKTNPQHIEVLARFQKVESRGRYKGKSFKN